ncbi:MAG: hypothetical protein RL272_631 [Candidatus Parcubacteria bacterium]|jgi:hypothetical protein
MTFLLAFLLSNTLIIFAVAFACGMLARYWAQNGKIGKARWAARFAFGGSSLLVVVQLGLTAFAMRSGNAGQALFNLLFAVLWLWIASNDLKLLRMLR